MVAFCYELWFNECMPIRKSEAIGVLGGTVGAAAEAMCITYQVVDKWPDVLSNKVSDRVLAAWTRKHIKSIPEAVKRHCTHRLEAAVGGWCMYLGCCYFWVLVCTNGYFEKYSRI